MKKQANDGGSRRWERELKPVLKQVERRGFVARLTIEMAKRVPERSWSRQMLDRWLSSDPARRTEPLVGIGLVLLDAAAAVKKKMDADEAKKKSTRKESAK